MSCYRSIEFDNPPTELKRIALAAFPSYRGRKYALKISDDTLNVASYWDGGSRDYFTFVNLVNLEVMPVPQQSAFDKQIPGAKEVSLPPGCACVEHSIFCGKDLGLTVHIPTANKPKWIPEPDTLSYNECIVLYATRSYKNTYAGKSHCRFLEATRATGITRDDWVSAQAGLIESAHLRKNRSITAKGTNVIRGLFNFPKS